MEYVHGLVFVLLSISTYQIAYAFGEEESEEACCEPRFVGGLKSCPNFDNSKVNLDSLILGLQNFNEVGGLILSGSLKLLTTIDDDYNIELSVSKLTDLGKEYVWGAGADVCSSMKDKDVPWASLLESMNISSCPISIGTYTFQDAMLDLNFAKKVMTRSFCDDYEVSVLFLKTLETIACYVFDVEIYVKN